MPTIKSLIYSSNPKWRSILGYSLYILSEETVNVTVLVEDERACLTHDSSGLSSAVVELSNDNRGFRVQIPTDEFGKSTLPLKRQPKVDLFDLIVV